MKKIIIGALVLALIIICASAGYDYISENYTALPDAPESNKLQPVKQLAPDFTVYDKDGNALSLSDLKGRPVVANFWATWCGPCKQEMPAFEKVYKEFGDEIVFLMVNLPDGETVDSVLSFVSESGYTFPVYFDSEYSASVTYGIRSIPATLMVDSEGFIAAAHTGAMSEDMLRQYISSLK